MVSPRSVPPLLVESAATPFFEGFASATDQVPLLSPAIDTRSCLEVAVESELNVSVNGTSLILNGQIQFDDRFKAKPPCFKVYSRRKVILTDPVLHDDSGLSSALQLFKHNVVKPVDRILIPAPQS
jgi:hypothetical protein